LLEYQTSRFAQIAILPIGILPDVRNMRAYRFRIYPSKHQEKELNHHLWIEKNLWNTLLEKTIEKYDEDKKFYSKTELQLFVKDSGLYSQSAQAVAHNLDRSLKAKVRAKKRGEKWGFPRFKSFYRMRSILYPQSGFKLDKKLRVTPFGDFNIVQHRIMKGTVKTLSLKREPTGKWFAIFTVENTPEPVKENHGPSVGIDLGIITLAALSDGTKIKNPKQFKKLEPQLILASRVADKKKKGSHNKRKAYQKLALVHEKIANVRQDYLHKQANWLVNSYSKIALEDLEIQTMSRKDKGHGKGINDASWGTFTNMIQYKAESAGTEVVFIDPRNTSKECSQCHTLVKKTLWERQHECPSCGLSIDRDINAAINILTRATVGITGSNASGEELVSSLKEEAPTLASARSG
jgi:putative transposase